jgi:transcriptional regulator with XRE-family HTH domain
MSKQPLQRHQKELLARFGENVRRERRKQGYTQEAFAERVELHPTMVQKIEGGQTNILVTTLMRLQTALRCPWEDLFPETALEEDRELEHFGRQLERMSATRPDLKSFLTFINELARKPGNENGA